jgi:hypothetical protein
MRMRNLAVVLCIIAFPAFAYEGPAPLKDIKVLFSATLNSSNGLYSYNYTISNPSSNNGEIRAIRISINRDPQIDGEVSSNGLTYCPHHSNLASETNLAKTPMVPVGATTPNGWSCNYQPQGNFSFGSVRAHDRIKPGSTSSGYVLKSFALPGIRDVAIEPTIELDRLPPSYYENDIKLGELEDIVRWTGKTVGPKAPPKVFVPATFLDYLISLKDQSVTLGWIKGKEGKELDKIFDLAKKELAHGNQKALRQAIGKLIKQTSKNESKNISAEAQALLVYNAKYFLAQLPKPKD